MSIMRGLKNVSYLTAGNIISKLISFVGMIFIARWLGPEKYGIYVTVTVFVGLFGILTMNGLKKVVIRRGSRNLSEMDNVIADSISIKNIFIMLAILFCILASFFMNYSNQTKMYIAIFSLVLFFRPMKGLFFTVYQVTEKMKYMAFIRLSYSVIFVSMALSLIYFGFGLTSVILISIFTHMIVTLLTFFHSRKTLEFRLPEKFRINKKLLIPSLTFTGIAFVNFLSTRIDLFMISILGSSEQVGIYGVAHNLIKQGLFLRSMVSTAFYPIFIKTLKRRKMSRSRLVKYSIMFFISLLGLAIIGYFVLDEIILILFGSEYAKTVPILRVLIFYIAFWFAALPFGIALPATNNEKASLISVSIIALMNIPLNYILFLKYGLIGIAYSTLIVWSIGSLLLISYSYFLLDKQGYLN